MKPMRMAYWTNSILFILNSSFTIYLIRLSPVKSANFLILLEAYFFRNEICTQLTTNYYLDYTLQKYYIKFNITFSVAPKISSKPKIMSWSFNT